MGYRSNCTLIMKEVDYEKMLMDSQPDGKFPDATLLEYVDCIDEKLHFVDNDGRRYVKLYWYDIKWYDGNVTDYLRGQPDHVYYEFARIGEDYDDVGYMNQVPDDEKWRLSVVRDFDFDDSNLKQVE